MVNVDISRILCINTKERTDRLKRIRALSNREDIDIKFIRSDKNNKSGEKGKIQSHLAIIKTAKEKNSSTLDFRLFQLILSIGKNFI